MKALKHCLRSFGKNISFLLYWIHAVKMQLNSNLNFTRPWMFYLQAEAVLKASLLLNWRLLH